MQAVDFTVVIPVFNEAQNVLPLLQRLVPVLEALSPSYQVLFVDDGSTDDTLSQVRDAARANPRIEAVQLARNFGHQIALTAGLENARGRVVISMDGDLQHPPELIASLVSLYHEGHDVVYTARTATARESFLKRFASGAFYKVFNWLSPVRILESSSDFRLLSRKAVDAVNAMPERHRFLRGLLPWTGLRSAVLRYEAAPRHAGTAKYSPARSFAMALDASFSFSRVPLQMATYLGLLTTLGCLAYFALSVAAWAMGWPVQSGWTSLIASMLFLGGVQLMFVGILGEYVGRIYEEVKQRPLYVVQEHVRANPDLPLKAAHEQEVHP